MVLAALAGALTAVVAAAASAMLDPIGLPALALPYLVVSLGFTSSYVMWFGLIFVLVVLVKVFMKDAPYFQYREMGIDIDPDALLLACGEVPADRIAGWGLEATTRGIVIDKDTLLTSRPAVFAA